MFILNWYFGLPIIIWILFKIFNKIFRGDHQAQAQKVIIKDYKYYIKRVSLLVLVLSMIVYYERDYLEVTWNNFRYKTKYDLIIDIDTVTSLNQNGWLIMVNDKSILSKKEKRIVGFYGKCNVGKTDLLNRLENINLPSGYSVKNDITPGLALKIADSSKKATSSDIQRIYMDIQGHSRTISSSVRVNTTHVSQTERIITDNYIRDAALQYANQIIYMFDSLSPEEVELITRIIDDRRTYENVDILIVMNYKNIDSAEVLLDQFDSDFGSLYGTRDHQEDLLRYTLKNTINVIAMGKHSLLQKFYSYGTHAHNEAALKFIKDKFLFMGKSTPKEMDTLGTFIKVAESTMSKYFFSPIKTNSTTKHMDSNDMADAFLKNNIQNVVPFEDNVENPFKLTITTLENNELNITTFNQSIVLANKTLDLVLVPLDYVIGDHTIHYDIIDKGDSIKILMETPGVEKGTLSCRHNEIIIRGRKSEKIQTYSTNQILNNRERIYHSDFLKKIMLPGIECTAPITEVEMVNGLFEQDFKKLNK